MIPCLFFAWAMPLRQDAGKPDCYGSGISDEGADARYPLAARLAGGGVLKANEGRSGLLPDLVHLRLWKQIVERFQQPYVVDGFAE
jgi:hypothetical protein